MGIDLRDYTRTAAQRGWGAGWPSCNGAIAAGTAVVTATRSRVRVSVHKRVARLVQLLVDETERRGYLLRDGQCGGYNCRPIAGTSSPSNHSWALAVDVNWQANPYAQPRRTDMPDWLPLLWNRYGWAWGGNYNNNGQTGKADSMHLEFMGTPEQADEMTALALRELTLEDDLPTPADVWAHPISDEYTATPGDTLPAFAALGFVTARVTWALEQIQAVAQVVTRLETKVDRLQATPAVVSQTGTADLSDTQLARIATACADEQARRLTA